ncbi:MAG: NADH-quinone oxidoreductase subunit NuoG [Desulfobacteraceae bacterium]|nr:NADH-quinone oxidoreductase subunit NuoG [Desulfobacteraceae bacterium]
MPKLIIDNREIEVPEGTKVIKAAEKLGIYIPRFCFHHALGAVGACRVCAVKFQEGPVDGVQMSCMIDAQDGMKVSTADPEAADFRRSVIEWLMLNHPHDCPVCDEGGHCLLQDLTVAGGHGIRRSKGRKRTYTDQYLGPLVYHEMNRCIQCYRCVRFYREYSGYSDLGVTGIAGRVYFGRLREGILESPFAGNLIDICPTGVYTDRPSRYTGRRWDFERTPGVCIHCSLGCRTTVSARYRQVVRVEGRFSQQVNRDFICDRGRYGFYYADRPGRPRNGRINGQTVSAQQAVEEARDRLQRITQEHGPEAVGIIGSARSSLQTLSALVHLCHTTGWQGPVFRNTWIAGAAADAAVRALSPENAFSMREIETADAILAVGADPVNEAPMLALAMRQAQRTGAEIIAIDPRPLDWPFDFAHLACRAEEMEETLASAAERLSASRRPVVICGTEITDDGIVMQAADLVAGLRGSDKRAGLFCTMPQANSFGAALLDESNACAADLADRIETGQIRALAVFESDLWHVFPDRSRLSTALEKLDLLVSVDFLDTPLFENADIGIPSLTVFEAGGIYVNQEGRAQQVRPAHTGGLPIAAAGLGDHPPRSFSPDVPGRDMPAAWAAAFSLSGQAPPETDAQMTAWMRDNFAVLADLAHMEADGVRLFAGRKVSIPDEAQIPEKKPDQFLELLPAPTIFGGEPMSGHSQCLRELAGLPAVWMARADADRLGIADDDRVSLGFENIEVTLNVRISDPMAQGVLVVYRHPDIDWQPAPDGKRIFISEDQIRRIEKA